MRLALKRRHKVYLGKGAATLNLAEAALMAAIAASPQHNPIDDEAAARRGQADLLYEMLKAGLIDRDQYEQAASTVIAIAGEARRQPPLAPEFINYARRQAAEILDGAGYDGARLLAVGGVRIVTTLDLDLYIQSECVMRAHLDLAHGGAGDVAALDGSDCVATAGLSTPAVRDDSALPDSATLVVLDAESGALLSMVGDAELRAYQPAVILQPFAYMEGFLRRLVTPASMVYDLPEVYPGPEDGLIYSVTSLDGRFRGPMHLRDAMAAGLLPPAAQVANESGIGDIIRTAQRIGFNSLDADRLDLQVLERGGSVSVLDAAYAYSVLAASGGMHGLAREPMGEGFRGRDPVAVQRIVDQAGRTIWQYDTTPDENLTPVIQPSLAYLVNDILADYEARERVLEREDALLRSKAGAAVINGLSEDRRDGWTIGYTQAVVVAVHSDRRDGAAMSLDYLERAASAPIWQAIMNHYYERENLPPGGWQAPADVEEFLVCEISGMLPAATDHCPTRREIVPAGSPLFRDTYWQAFEINRVTGRLATALTQDSLRQEVVYFVPPEAIWDWWIDNDKPLPPTLYDSEDRPEILRAVQLTEPADYAYVGGRVAIAGAVNERGAERYSLQVGAGVNPQEWMAIVGETNISSPFDLNVNWDTAGMQGVYTLRVTVDFNDGRSLTDTKQVTLDNTPPAIELRTSDGRDTIAYPAQEVVSLLAHASDNLTIERVEFFEGGELLGIDREWPYGFEYAVGGTGALDFVARVYDQVGNSAYASLSLTVKQP